MKATVLLLPGLCSTPDELLPVHSALRRDGCDVRAPNVPGYSFDATAMRQRARPAAIWVAATCAAIDAVPAERPLIVVGLSAGAVLALAAAMERSARIAGLVLMSTPLRLDGWAVPRHHFLLPLALYSPLGRLWKYRERAPYGVKNTRVRGWIEHELATRRVSRAGAAALSVPHLRELDRLRRRVRNHLDSFACPPVLVLHAEDDEVASPANVRLLEQGLRTPSFRKLMLTDSYHMITIDNDRPRVVHAVVEFARRMEGQFAAAASAAGVVRGPQHL